MTKYRPITVWLTGLPSSGKTTLGSGLKLMLSDDGLDAIILDGDDVRKSICADLGFTEKDRSENIRRVASIAKLLNSQGLLVICCFVSPMAEMRQMAKDIIGENSFFEVFVDASIQICCERDVKGLYSKASKGMIKDLTGISAPYEKPISPNLHLRTDKLSETDCLNNLHSNVLSWIKG